MKTTAFFILSVLIVICSCKKVETEDELTCINIGNATLFNNSPRIVGQTIKFGTQEVGGYRIYSWNGPNNYTNQYPDDSIPNAELKHEGWYYLNLFSVDGKCQKTDSFYMDMQLPQGTAPCTITNNTATYNNLPNDIFTSVTKGIDPGLSQKFLNCSGPSFGNLKIYFHTNWRNKEPEDGIYTTINTPVFDQTDNNYNKVFITSTKSSIYWSGHENQLVYVSHIGSKLQVRFCNLSMSGSNGTSYTTIASGNIVEQ
ncbi:MAG TPA: hypothetical protein VK489_03780 [Ferruginibacter sp.]|nr:hypothetical protein [Ferruginibacter sp.]